MTLLLMVGEKGGNYERNIKPQVLKNANKTTREGGIHEKGQACGCLDGSGL
jgi:hypothetical protein